MPQRDGRQAEAHRPKTDTTSKVSYDNRHEPARGYNLRPGRCWICVGPNVWGKAFSAEQAEQNARQAAGNPDRKTWRFVMYDAPPDCTIDEMGRSAYTPALYGDADRVGGHPLSPEERIGGPAIKVYSWNMPADTRTRD